MSDDLVKRLRELVPAVPVGQFRIDQPLLVGTCHEAAGRIEALEREIARINFAWEVDLDTFRRMLRAAWRKALEEAAQIARAQPYYPDTKVGMRQQWVKDQIEAGILDLADKGPPQ
jgi:hypothetical protein